MGESDGVKYIADLVIAQKCGIELDEGVQMLFRKHVGADGLDLLGRAAVHCGDGHAGADVGADALFKALQCLFVALEICAFQDAALFYQALENSLVLFEQRAFACIDHIVDIGLHLGLFYSFEVVAHAHVEDEIGSLCLSGECRLDEMDCEPGFEILVIGLLEGVFGRPFHVVALVACVDTGLCYLQMIHDLDGLEFHEAAADHVCAHYVLGKLGMRSGSRSQRCGALLSEDLDRVFSVGPEEILFMDSENRTVVAVLLENPSDKLLERNRTHSITHGITP